MGAGLVGNHIRAHAATHQFGQHVGGVGTQADGNRTAFGGVFFDACQRIVQIVGLLVQITGTQAEVDAGLLAFDVQRAGASQGSGQGLRAAHTAQTGGEDPFAAQIAAVVLAAGFDEGFVSALYDALRADVNPAAGGHLAVHRQAFGVQFVEVFPSGPVRHQIGIGQQHARRVFVGFEHAHRFAGLNQQGLVVVQLF